MKLPTEPTTTIFKVQPLVWTLLFSVVLNLVLAGAFLGVLPKSLKYKSFAPMVLSTTHGEYAVDYIVRYLDPADAAVFREAYKEQAAAIQKAHDNVREATTKVYTLFADPEVDTAALQTAMGQLNLAKSEVDDAISKVLENAYAKMTPDGRRRLSEIAQKPL